MVAISFSLLPTTLIKGMVGVIRLLFNDRVSLIYMKPLVGPWLRKMKSLLSLQLQWKMLSTFLNKGRVGVIRLLFTYPVLALFIWNLLQDLGWERWSHCYPCLIPFKWWFVCSCSLQTAGSAVVPLFFFHLFLSWSARFQSYVPL